jgi:hypothetical protein
VYDHRTQQHTSRTPLVPMIRLLGGLLLLVALIVGAFASLVLLLPVAALIPIHFLTVIRWRRRVANFVSGFFFDYAAALLTDLCKTNIYVYSDDDTILSDRGNLIMANQRTKLDWMYSGKNVLDLLCCLLGCLPYRLVPK